MPRPVIALLAGAFLCAAACKRIPGAGNKAMAAENAADARATDRIVAGGVLPPAGALSAPRPAKLNPEAGGNLFAAMNCDGCHGGGAVGWMGPSLVDGRWRYGGSDEEIFRSIFYGRPKGMPAFGGVIGTDGVWMLVAYIKSQAVPSVVPTTSWLPGGNVTATPPGPAPQGPEAEEKASPSRAAQSEAKAATAPEQMPVKYGCIACHAVDHKVVGPAFKDVAARYRGQDVEERLVQKVRNGGSGVWGSVAMTPNPQVPDQDLHALVKWVLSLK